MKEQTIPNLNTAKVMSLYEQNTNIGVSMLQFDCIFMHRVSGQKTLVKENYYKNGMLQIYKKPHFKQCKTCSKFCIVS